MNSCGHYGIIFMDIPQNIIKIGLAEWEAENRRILV
jgi:hypothetical protein